MGKPAGYIVRSKDMKTLHRELTRQRTSWGDVWDAAKTLVAWAEPQQTQLPPVSVASLALPLNEPVTCGRIPILDAFLAATHPQPYDMPSPEADALDRIADLWGSASDDTSCLREIAKILHEAGRLGSVFGS